MILIDIDPVAFMLGNLEIRWYGIMVALAVLTILAVSMREAKRTGISEDLLLNLFLWGIVGGLLLSRVVHVVDHMFTHPGQPIDFFNFAGLGLYGAILGAPLSAFIYTRVTHLPWSSMAKVGDAVALGAPLGQAIGRVGCLINGCCHGAIAGVPWAVIYDHPNSFCSTPNAPVHPTQAYFIIWNLVVFGVIFWMRKWRRPEGVSFIAYLMLYSAGDMIIRFWRVNEIYAVGLQQGQIISLAIILACVPIMVIKWRNFRREGASAEPDSSD